MTARWTGLSDAYSQRFQNYGFGPEWLDSAISLSERALALDSDLAEAYKSLGLAYALKGGVIKSLEANLEAAQRNPNIAAINLASKYIDRAELDQALFWSRKALELSPTRPWPYFRIGKIHAELNQYEEAERWLKQAVSVEPDFTWGHWELGNLFIRQRRYQRAAAQAERLLVVGRDFVPGLSLAGTIELRLGNLEMAREFFQEAIRLCSVAGDPGARLSLGYILLRAGHEELGQELLDEVLEQDQSWLEGGDERSEVRWRVAAIYAVRGEKEEAYRWLHEAVQAGWRGHDFISDDPLFENLHQESRFADFMSQVRAKIRVMRDQMETSERGNT